ncbi:hypothetical protein TrLO_g6331 [Triparma laevis f. longispina]|uniref:Uncharacterized protein n=1 Tax=Triparma laevis f. longispina TaxID=1714387 RepID=A0A9W7F4R0_9STRA|nr:hypothetical protein TrLO_g6331 [Triparma laevis f. longispina]
MRQEAHEFQEFSRDELVAKLRESEAQEAATRVKIEASLKEAETARKEQAALAEAAWKFFSVINDLNKEKEALKLKLKKPGTATAPASDICPLDLEKPNVTKFDDNVASSTTTNCSLNANVHEPSKEVFDALFGDYITNVTNKMLYKKMIEGSRGEGSVIAF